MPAVGCISMSFVEGMRKREIVTVAEAGAPDREPERSGRERGRFWCNRGSSGAAVVAGAAKLSPRPTSEVFETTVGQVHAC